MDMVEFSDRERERIHGRLQAGMGPRGECVWWTGALYKTFYGAVWFRGKMVRVHRLVYEMDVGPVGAKHVGHRCEAWYPKSDPTYKRCAAVSHLYLTDLWGGMIDAAENGRLGHPHRYTNDPQAMQREMELMWAHRVPYPSGVLDESEVRLIRQQRAEGWTYRAIADHFGIAVMTAWYVANKRTYSDIV